MKHREESKGRTIAAGAAILALVGVAGPAAAGTITVKEALASTHADDNARGALRLVIKGSRGDFEVKASHLDRDARYDVIVGGVKVGILQCGSSGAGRVRFRSQPSGSARLLGFDPRGNQVSVRNHDGTDVLVAHVSPESLDPTKTACCGARDDSGSDCEDRTPDACTAAGGTPSQAATCLPDPCGGTTPSAGEVVCCRNQTHDDGSDAECERESAAQCAALAGTVVQATSCDPNPCAPTPAGDVIACCVADATSGLTSECEDITAEACTARGGTPATAVACDPDPCGGAGDGDASGDASSDASGETGDDHLASGHD